MRIGVKFYQYYYGNASEFGNYGGKENNYAYSIFVLFINYIIIYNVPESQQNLNYFVRRPTRQYRRRVLHVALSNEL